MSSPLTHPLLRAGLADPRLRNHHAFHVLVQLVELLGDDPQPVYQSALSITLHIDRKTIRQAMSTLVKRQYLREYPANANGVRSYALNAPTRADMGNQSPRSRAAPLPAVSRSA